MDTLSESVISDMNISVDAVDAVLLRSSGAAVEILDSSTSVDSAVEVEPYKHEKNKYMYTCT